jgi:hypothetical protein
MRWTRYQRAKAELINLCRKGTVHKSRIAPGRIITKDADIQDDLTERLRVLEAFDESVELLCG